MGEWQMILVEPAKTMFSQIGQFLVSFLLVIFILLIGWLIARAIKAVITKVLATLKLDDLADKISLTALLTKGGITYGVSELIGVIFYWLMLLITFVIAINAIGLTIAAELLNRIVLYIPNIIAAIFILILGMFVATILKNIVQTAAKNAGLSQSAFLANLVEIVIIVFAVLIALEQLNIGARIIELIVSIVLASFGLGWALAFGLGCKDIAGKMVADTLEKFKNK